MTVKLSYTTEDFPSIRATVYRLKGTVDSSKCLERFYEHINSNTATLFIFNLKEIDFINSCGFGEFLVLNDSLQNKGKQAVFTDLNPKVKDVFKVLGGLILLKVEASESEVLAKHSAQVKTDGAGRT